MKPIETLNCVEAVERLDDYVDRELRLDDLASVREHLATCAECDRRFRFETRLLMAVRRKLREVGDADAVHARVLRRLEAERAPCAAATARGHAPTRSSASTPATTGKHVAWMLDLHVRPGHEASLRRLVSEMVESMRALEHGALDCEWYLSEDGRRCHVLERYADDEAALAHLAGFGSRFARTFFEHVVPERMVLYGPPGDAVRKALARLAPVLMVRADGFSRRASDR